MLIGSLFETLGRYLHYRSLLASIIELDDRTLSDIGLNRSALRAAAWNTASHRALIASHSRTGKKARASARLDLCLRKPDVSA